MTHCVSNPEVVDVQEPQWYALYVRHQSEYKVARILDEKFGVPTRVPSQTLWRKGGKRLETFMKPLLGMYIFALTNFKAMNTMSFYSVNGVLGFVRHKGAPAVIPLEEIETLEKMGLSTQPVHAVEYRRFAPNDRVEVIKGPLRGALGFFQRSNEKTGQFIVSLEMFSRTLTTELDALWVRPY